MSVNRLHYLLIVFTHLGGMVGGVLTGLILSSAGLLVGIVGGGMGILVIGMGLPALVASQLNNEDRVFFPYIGFALCLLGLGVGIFYVLPAQLYGVDILPASMSSITRHIMNLASLFWFAIAIPLGAFHFATRSPRFTAPTA